MKKILVFLFISVAVTAQKKVNNYKYIIVPKKLEAFNESDKYQTSSLTKFLFNKNGFIAFLSDEELPEDLAKNKCGALTADIKEDSGMFSTKTTIVLKDCFNKIVYKGTEGKSKMKNYKKAYHEAIRNSFNGIKKLNYKYIPLEESNTNANVDVENTVTNVVDKEPKRKENIAYDLFANYSSNGFILKDASNNISYEILRTSNPEIFIIKNKNGVFLKKDSTTWIAQYYTDDKLTMKPYKVKFN
ncbi:hypothetical protein [Tenacibaculum amylolyticum]|uniref:hypothetical protein n=1 Tax=Tenacibaculum amylolyticum TaxID=104269 RepID=UPI0038937518